MSSSLASRNRLHHWSHQQISEAKIRLTSQRKNGRLSCWEVKEVLEVLQVAAVLEVLEVLKVLKVFQVQEVPAF